MSDQASIQQYDRGVIFESIVELFQNRTEWHGFRSRTEIGERFEKGEVAWIHRGGSIVCAATYRHRQTSHTRVYFTAMGEAVWDPESWQQMIRTILFESPHDRLISKTPLDCEESGLWDEAGIRIREEDTLGVWEVRDQSQNRLLEEW